MPRRALIVGINTYGDANDLHACVADAQSVMNVLARHKDGEKNFDCIAWLDRTASGELITRGKLRAAVTNLFSFNGDVLLYFSGHGFLSPTGGVLGTSDGTTDDWGIPMQEVVDLATGSVARQILIVLDCCHAGEIANPGAMNAGRGINPLAVLRENVTVIVASRA